MGDAMPGAQSLPRQRYDAVLFDLDDTLTVTRSIKFEMHKAIARDRHARVLSDDDIRAHYAKPIEESLRALHGTPDTPASELFAILSRYQERFPHRPQEDALLVVRTLLAAELYVGIITGSAEWVVRPVLADLGFPVDEFVGVYCYNSEPLRKPDPAVFDEAKQRLRAKLRLAARPGPGEPVILYVGDGLEDYQAARAAGVDFIGVTTGTVTAAEFREAGATHCVPVLADVLRAIRLTGAG